MSKKDRLLLIFQENLKEIEKKEPTRMESYKDRMFIIFLI
jgi:hypothetical protein